MFGTLPPLFSGAWRPVADVAGGLNASAFFILYLILFVAHSIFKRRPESASYPDYCEESLLGFDARGELKIESKYSV